jgi:hypothetical protein
VVALNGDDVLHVVAEVYGTRMTDDDLVRRAMALQNHFPIELWYCDPSEPDAIVKFRRNNLPAKPAPNDIRPGIAAVSRRLRTGGLRVFRGCSNLVREAGLYRYPTPEEKKIVGENPIDQDNHALSALRYLVAGIDRVRPTPGAQRVAAPEPAPAPPLQAEDYATAFPQTRYQVVVASQPVPDLLPDLQLPDLEEQRRLREAEELRRENRRHLETYGWENWF